MIHRKNEAGEKEIFNRGYYSSVLDKHRKNLLPCEGEAIGMKLVNLPLIVFGHNIA